MHKDHMRHLTYIQTWVTVCNKDASRADIRKIKETQSDHGPVEQ